MSIFRRSSRRRSDEPQTIDYWLSYSDLMAGLLLVFIILLVGTLYALKDNLERQQEELLKSQERLVEIDTGVADILGVRAKLLERIKTRFEQAGGNISFDDATGAVRLGSNILFREGSGELTTAGKEQLDEVMPVYLDALLGDPSLRQHVDRIVFEGHTNSNYDGPGGASRAYLFNLQLSQARAYSAMEHVIKSGAAEQLAANEMLAATGFSSSRLIYSDSAQTVEDKVRSRRLEVRFRLKDEEALRRLKGLFDERSATRQVDTP